MNAPGFVETFANDEAPHMACAACGARPDLKNYTHQTITFCPNGRDEYGALLCAACFGQPDQEAIDTALDRTLAARGFFEFLPGVRLLGHDEANVRALDWGVS